MGSPAIGAFLAHAVFWVVLALGWSELGARRAAIFVGLWLLGFFGIPRLGTFAGLFFAPYVALLDAALVFVVFRGDAGSRS